MQADLPVELVFTELIFLGDRDGPEVHVGGINISSVEGLAGVVDRMCSSVSLLQRFN